ncbi:hypothetical protein Hanom_Chr14g01252251 [Helianthus anomalus]
MPPEYGAIYPQEGDTAGDAPAGYVTMFADFFGDCNLRLPLNVFVAEILEYYKLHISQLSPVGMIRVRNFEYTFIALGLEPNIGDFRRFYQLSAAAITAKLQFRNVTGTIITENISVSKADTVDWFPRLHIIGWVKLDNRQLWVLRMMLGRLSWNARPVLREKNGGWNRTILNNFRLPNRATLEAVLPKGKGRAMAAGGSTTGTKPVDDKKSKGGAPVAGGEKASKLRKTRATAIPKPKRAVTASKLIICYTSVVVPVVTDRCVKFCVETREEPVSLFATPPSSPKVADVEVQKEGGKSPSIKVDTSGGTPPSVHAEETVKETAGETVGDDVSNDPFACREILRGLGTPFETAQARGLPRQNRINQLSSMLVGREFRLRAEAEAMVKAAREGAEQLEKDKAGFEKLKQTETWAASAGFKQVRYLTTLLSDERKGWREACARENEKVFRVLQELNNLKATNAALMKEKAAAEAAAKEAETRGATALKEAEARATKVFEEADADHAKLNKAVEELKAEVQSRVVTTVKISCIRTIPKQ